MPEISRTQPRLRFSALLCVTAALFSFGQLREPFPIGYAMGNQGSIVWSDGQAGRQPWTPAAFLSDTLWFGLACAGVDYYAGMDNLSERSIFLGAVGGWYAGRHLVVKAAYLHFDALRVYFEQTGFISVGTDLLRYVALSLETRGTRAGLVSAPGERETLGELGISAWIPRTYLGFSVRADHVTLKKPGISGLSRDPLLRLGIHTKRHRYGAQGVVGEVALVRRPHLRFTIGQEFWIHPSLGLCAALSSDPVLVSVGAAVVLRRVGADVSLAHHPVLGWSTGACAEYAQPRAGDYTKGRGTNPGRSVR